MEKKEYKLIDNSDQNRYEFRIGEYIAEVDYIKSTDNKIRLTHVEVPSVLEGQGIGSQLVKKVLEDIEKQGLKLIPLCPFVISYIKRHPEWERIVINE